MKFTEAQLEQAFIELLGQEDIPHVLGGDIVSFRRRSFNQRRFKSLFT